MQSDEIKIEVKYRNDILKLTVSENTDIDEWSEKIRKILQFLTFDDKAINSILTDIDKEL